MDKKQSILNISVAVLFNAITMVLAIWIKRWLIQICGNEVNGLNSLYASIIGTLSIAELGVGTAITFCMYRPIVAGDRSAVAALYNLFRRAYLVIGGIILLAGMILLPNLHHFAKDYTQTATNIYTTFFLSLVTVVVTYFFGAKTALINAHKNNYITTAINSGGIVLQYIMQAVVLHINGSFEGFLLCKLIVAMIQGTVTEVIVRKKYTEIITLQDKLDNETKKDVYVHIKAMFVHKVGGILVNSVDSIVISSFIGVVVLGKYSNYTAIMNYVVVILNLVFSAVTSIIGHFYVKNSMKETKQAFEFFHLAGFVLGTIFFLGYFAIIDNLIAILFDKDLVIARSISVVITVNGFVQYMRRAVLTFRDATGTFYYDRWKPLCEGAANLFLSVLLVKKYGVSGVLIATILTNLLICHIVEPYILYKHAFGEVSKQYFLRNYGMIAVFTLAVGVLRICMQEYEGEWMELLVNGMFAVLIGAVICAVVVFLNWGTAQKGLHMYKADQ